VSTFLSFFLSLFYSITAIFLCYLLELFYQFKITQFKFHCRCGFPLPYKFPFYEQFLFSLQNTLAVFTNAMQLVSLGTNLLQVKPDSDILKYKFEATSNQKKICFSICIIHRMTPLYHYSTLDDRIQSLVHNFVFPESTALIPASGLNLYFRLFRLSVAAFPQQVSH